MIIGGHVVIYTKDAEADREFFRDALGFPAVDVGSGWLIFAMPAAELAMHPARTNNRHELFLTCDDLRRTIVSLRKKGARVGRVAEEQWGIRTSLRLPGGGKIGLYQPKHPVTYGSKPRRGKGKAVVIGA
jgi:catechol 2,3-dioxygenase-like lactoylglutathione lyase family enzyme